MFVSKMFYTCNSVVLLLNGTYYMLVYVGIQLNKRSLPIRGTNSEVGGMDSATSNMNTENDSNNVILKYTPQTGLIQLKARLIWFLV